MVGAMVVRDTKKDWELRNVAIIYSRLMRSANEVQRRATFHYAPYKGVSQTPKRSTTLVEKLVPYRSQRRTLLIALPVLSSLESSGCEISLQVRLHEATSWFDLIDIAS